MHVENAPNLILEIGYAIQKHKRKDFSLGQYVPFSLLIKCPRNICRRRVPSVTCVTLKRWLCICACVPSALVYFDKQISHFRMKEVELYRGNLLKTHTHVGTRPLNRPKSAWKMNGKNN